MLALKLFLVPTLILGVSRIGRWFGPRVAGSVSSLPLVAGPLLWLLALTNGAEFGARAAASALLGVSACASYNIVYVFASRRTTCLGALATSLMAWILMSGATIGLAHRSLPLQSSFTGLILWLTRTILPEPQSPPAPVPLSRLEMPAPAMLAASLTWIVNALASRAEARWSGLLSAFPLLSIVLSVSSHRNHGAIYVAALLRAMVKGLPSLALFCLVVAALLPSWGVTTTFVTALIASVAIRSALGRLERGTAVPRKL